MAGILDSLLKIGFSSNQLLKCVLLNTAIELFSYVDAMYYEWSMEDIDHSYYMPPVTGKTVESDVLLPPLPSYSIADEMVFHDTSVPEDTACIMSEDEQETMYLPIPESPGVKDSHASYKLDSEPFYYLVGPIHLWLEFPYPFDMQVSVGISSAVKKKVVVKDCGVQTTKEPLNGEEGTLDKSVPFNYGSDGKASILWDSYDLHLSSSPVEFKDKYEAETELLAQQEVENFLYSDLISVHNVNGKAYPQKGTVKPTRICSQNATKLLEQPVSSTPSLERMRRVQQYKGFPQNS